MKLKESKIKSHKIYSGKILDFYCDEIKTYSNKIATREYSRHVFAVAIVLKVGDKYLLEKQFRYPIHKITLEVPAGKSNKGETPLEAIKREVKEETGYILKNIKSLGRFYPAPAYSDEILYLFKAEAKEKVDRNLDEDEAIDLCYYSKEEIINLLKNNVIDDSKTIIALTKYFYAI